MSVYDDFFETYKEALDAKEVPEAIIKKYENILPQPIIELWKKHGFGGYRSGLFWTINPDEYMEYVKKWIKIEWEDTLPIMRTAFGDIIIIYNINKEDIEYKQVGVKVIDLKHSKSNTITIGLDDFFKNYLMQTGSLMAKTNIDDILFLHGRCKLSILKSDQCYGFEKILSLGGKEKDKNMKIFNYFDYLEILTQTHLLKQSEEKKYNYQKPPYNDGLDKNLKYAIFDELKFKKFFKFKKKDFFKKYLKKDYAPDASYYYEPIKDVENYYLSLNLNEYPMKKLTELSWSASSEIITDIWGNYDGEDDYFDILSLEGIEICPNIKSIHIEYVWSVKDLSPLKKLNNLEEISISSVKIEVNSLKPLLELPKLKKLHLEGITFKDQSETDQVIEELKKKGVKVEIK